MAYMDVHEELHAGHPRAILLNEHSMIIFQFVAIIGDEDHPENLEA